MNTETVDDIAKRIAERLAIAMSVRVGADNFVSEYKPLIAREIAALVQRAEALSDARADLAAAARGFQNAKTLDDIARQHADDLVQKMVVLMVDLVPSTNINAPDKFRVRASEIIAADIRPLLQRAEAAEREREELKTAIEAGRKMVCPSTYFCECGCGSAAFKVIDAALAAPLEVWEAEKIRDRELRNMNMNPDGTFIGRGATEP